jgi:hypothetical protein
VYSITLYCSDPACDAIFEAHGSLEAVAAAICPYCGCCLAELTCVPCADEEGTELEHLELWLVQVPAGGRLRRRRTRKGLPKAA